MRKTFSIWDLKYADEICFPDTFLELIRKHCPEFWMTEDMLFRGPCEFSLVKWIFKHSRASQDRGMGVVIDKILCDLLKVGYK